MKDSWKSDVFHTSKVLRIALETINGKFKTRIEKIEKDSTQIALCTESVKDTQRLKENEEMHPDCRRLKKIMEMYRLGFQISKDIEISEMYRLGFEISKDIEK